MRNIKYNELGENYMKMSFLNGEITVTGTPGISVISSGCGSGKTTIIKEIIRNNSSKGILYSAATIRECNEMYDWIINNLIGCYDNYNQKLVVSDIASIHSEPRYDENGNVNNGVDLNVWNKYPELFKDKKVIICTHHKLLHEYPDLLIGYNLNKVDLSSLNVYDRVDYMNDSGFRLDPRKYVLIDELPRCGVLKKSYYITDLYPLGITVPNRHYLPDGTLKVDRYCTRIEDYTLMKCVYEEIERNDKRLLITKSSNEPSNYRKDLILSDIHKNFYKYILSEENNINISCNILKLKNRFSRIMIFEGTGDLLFSNSKEITLYNIDNKYSSEINIEKFHNTLNRSIGELNSNEKKLELYSNINSLLDNLINSVFNNENSKKILIVTWKNLKSCDYENNKSLFNTEINENFSFTEYIKDYLLGRTNKEFSIIHYQSGLDRATNEFREYDSIVFLGEFHIPNSAIKEINEDLGSNCSPSEFSIHQLVQAICRTRIRNHKGESINVYFTDDWNDLLIAQLTRYLGSYNNYEYSIDDLNIRPKWKSAINKLCNYDSNISSSLSLGIKYNFEITLNDIFNLIPMSEKKVKKYYPLINYLRGLGIEMKIMTSWNS